MVLLIVLAVIFFVAMNNFKSVAPSAMAVKRHERAKAQGEDPAASAADPTGSSTSASDDTWNGSPPSRPNLDTMDKNTAQHTQAVNDTLQQGN